jgi:hypothetical protein
MMVRETNPGFDATGNWLDVLVTLEAAPDGAEACSREENFRRMQECARKQKGLLEGWLAEHGLMDEIAWIGEPTVFQMVHIRCTLRVAEALPAAPGVIAVIPDVPFTPTGREPERPR